MTHRHLILLILFSASACTTDDYSAGVTSFSQAVTKADSAEQSVATAAQTAQLDQWVKNEARKPPTDVSIDLAKCAAPSGYHAGDCSVVSLSNGAPPLIPDRSPVAALAKYSTLLAAIVTDKTCTTLESDAKDLGTSIDDMAKLAKAEDFAGAASPLATVASTFACWSIEKRQLTILRTATSAADPIIAKLVTLIADEDRSMTYNIANDDLSQLDAAEVDYQSTNSAADLGRMVSLASAVDKAQTLSAASLIIKVGTLHHNLTTGLQSPQVNLKNVQNDAEKLGTEAESLASSANSLASIADKMGSRAGTKTAN